MVDEFYSGYGERLEYSKMTAEDEDHMIQNFDIATDPESLSQCEVSVIDDEW